MISPSDFEFFKRFLITRSGLALTDDKSYLLESRLSPILRDQGMQTFGQLVARLSKPGSEALAQAVVEAMTTNESFFFRDKTPFDAFTSVMLPSVLKNRARGQTFRIWCAAASHGQEPYSLAMLIRENAALIGDRRVEIIGTDISRDVLDRAKAGIYNQFEVQRGLPVQYLVKYFAKNGENWQINSTIRDMVQYRSFNLLESFAGLGQFDIVFCRNVLIYFDQATKSDILGRIARLLAADGYLVLGGAETVVGLTEAFRPAPAPHRGFYVVNAPANAKPPMPSAGVLATAAAR